MKRHCFFTHIELHTGLLALTETLWFWLFAAWLADAQVTASRYRRALTSIVDVVETTLFLIGSRLRALD